MALVANLGLFFVFFLPLTYLVGLMGGFWVGPTQGSDDPYPLVTWVLVVSPLLLPSLLWVPIAHVLMRVGMHRFERSQVRLATTFLVPAGLLAVHLGAWGDAVLSGPLLVVMIVPGLLYGSIFRMPRVRNADRAIGTRDTG